MKKIRTRYAPSPTGFLHIGGARTALFSYLYAKHFNGEFIVRIEDTDQSRNIENGEKSQLENLEWLGIEIDESPEKPKEEYGPYRQSEKIERYNKLIDKLVKEGKAYKAYDSPDELDRQRKEQEISGKFSFRYDKYWLKISEEEIKRRNQKNEYTIRLALEKDKEYSWNDIVRGRISVNTKDIGDWVIRKMDGYPTYNFAVVVDDYDMKISHILRGEEHITNTPKQLAVYDAFNWETPEFGHLTIITNMEGKKLSKRDNSVKQFIEDYKNEQYHPHAIFNFLSLLGWTHKDAKEIISKEELIRDFEPARLSKSPSKFDIKKMEWFSKEYIKKMDNSKIKEILELKKNNDEWNEIFIETYKQSASTIKNIQDNFKIYNNSEVKDIDFSNVVSVFAKEIKDFDFTIENIAKAIKNTQTKTGEKGRSLFQPIRLACTYQEHGPELAKAIFLFGQKVIMERLAKCL